MTKEEKEEKLENERRIAELRATGSGMPPRLMARMSAILEAGELRRAREKRERFRRRREELMRQLRGNEKPFSCSPEEA